MTASAPSPLLDLRNLTKRYGGVVALESLDLAVGQGELITVLGPSGSGKSTILSLIAGFQLPTSGELSLRGKDISRLAPGQRDIGVVFQHYALFPHMTVEDNIAYPLKVRGWDVSRRSERVREMLNLVRLPGHENRSPRQLSGGQQQRVALARALAFEPSLLLMDEPLGALDREIRIEMKAEISRIHKELGTTIIYVTHDREEALALSDRVAIMRGGRLVAVGPPAELFASPPSAFVAGFFSGCNVLPVDSYSPSEGGSARVMLGNTEIVVRSTVQVGNVPVSLVLPHQSVQLRPSSGAPSLRAEVSAVLYLGDEIEVTFLLDRGKRLLGRYAVTDMPDLKVGAIVDVCLSLQRASLVKDDMACERPGSSYEKGNR